MRTEEQIVYEILNIVYGGKVSDDNEISPRLVQSFLRKHRASKLATYYSKGMNVDDFLFQNIGPVEFDLVKDLDYKSEVPALINFPLNYGIRLSKEGYYIPVVDRFAFELSKNNIINQSSPKATMDGSAITIYIGYSDPCNFLDTSSKEIATNKFVEESESIDNVPKIYADLSAVLYDPEDAPGYDWSRDPYPCPSDIIDQLTTSTLARDMELLIRQQSDKVSNAKDDKINFDDTIGVR